MEYRKALAREIMSLEEQGKRATLIPDLARGLQADAKYKRDLAELRYQSARESLRAIEQQMSGLQTIIRFQEEIEKKGES